MADYDERRRDERERYRRREDERGYGYGGEYRGGEHRGYGREGYGRDYRDEESGGRGYGGDYRGGYGSEGEYRGGREGYGREGYGEGGGYYGRSDYRSGREGYGGEYRGGYGREGYRGGRDDDRGFFERAGDEIASWFGSDEAERRRQMDARHGDSGAQHHRGRGPRGYTRSDDRIRDDINDRLTDDPYLDASEIEVSVSGGEVTLSGTVNSRQDKRRAEDLADDVSGVSHVQNNLRVRQAAGASQYGSTSGAGTTAGVASGITGTGDATGGTSGSTTTGTERDTVGGGRRT